MDKPQVLNIVRATPEHVKFVSANLSREEHHRLETYDFTAEEAVKQSFEMSTQCWVVEAPEGIVCMWGLVKPRTLLGGATAWLVATTLIEKYTIPLLRIAKPLMDETIERFGFVQGFVDPQHEKALRFFQWLGFKVEAGMLVGPNKIPFQRIYRRL